MLSAIVGVVIMAAATTAMVFAVQLHEQSFANAGRQPLSGKERELIKKAGYTSADIILLEKELEGFSTK